MLKTGQFQGSICAEALQCGPGTGLRLGLKLKGQTTWNESKCPTILYLWCPYMPFTCVYFHVFPNSIFPWTTHRPKAFCHFCLFSWLQVMLLLLYLYSVLGVSLFAKVIWAQLDFQQLDTLSKPSRRYLSGFALDSHRILATLAGRIHWRWSLWLPVCNDQHFLRVQHVSKFINILIFLMFWSVFSVFLCIVLFISIVLLWFALPSRVCQGPQANFRTFFQARTSSIHIQSIARQILDVWKILKMGDSLQMDPNGNFQ